MGVGGALPSSISPFLLTQSFCWVSPLETLFSFPPHFGPCRYNWISRFSLSKAGFSCYCCTGQKRKREEIDATISKLRVFFCLFVFNVLVWLSLLAFAPASFPVVVASSSLSPPTAPQESGLLLIRGYLVLKLLVFPCAFPAWRMEPSFHLCIFSTYLVDEYGHKVSINACYRFRRESWKDWSVFCFVF